MSRLNRVKRRAIYTPEERKAHKKAYDIKYQNARYAKDPNYRKYKRAYTITYGEGGLDGWFEFVNKVRREQGLSHCEAMKVASPLWREQGV